MIDHFISIRIVAIFLLMAGTAAAQPVGKSVSAQDSNSRISRPLTMADFRYQPQVSGTSFAPFQLMKSKPGVALLGSALIPGLGQAVNQKWVRAGAYLAADLLFLGLHFDSFNEARDRERQYKRFADQHWSVVNYAHWLVEYSDQNGISNENVEALRGQVEGSSPAYDPQTDWSSVNIKLLRDVERDMPFVNPEAEAGDTFSHVMPDYGSQQYYELISKYYQYGPGWSDFGSDRNGTPLDSRYRLAWDGSDMPAFFFQGAGLAEKFDDKYRLAGNMISLMVLNHAISAFDALWTVKLKKHRLETETNLFGTRQFIIKYHF